jgi:DNA replicative helicase MCM subunit Mcm2 (Cdc46/Mcm family)
VRLAEARARCELREEVTRADAEDAVEILEGALQARWGCVGGNMGG